MKEKRLPTLMQILLSGEVLYLIGFLVFALVSVFVLMRQEQMRMHQEMLSVAETQNVRLQEEMSGYEQYVWELLNRSIAEYDLESSDPNRQYFAKHRIHDVCSEICKFNPKLIYVFACQPGTYFVGQRGNNSFGSNDARDDLLTYLESLDVEKLPSAWHIDTIAHVPCLVYLQAADGHFCGCLLPIEWFRSSLVSLSGSGAMLSDSSGRTVEIFAKDTRRQMVAYTFDFSFGLTLHEEIPRSGAAPSSLPIHVGLLGLFILAALVGLASLVYRRTVIPINRLSREIAQTESDLAEGKEPEAIGVDANTREIFQLESSTRHLVDEVLLSRVKNVEHQLRQQDMELLMVRSQIRPHFYLNALTTIDAMTYQNRNEDIRKFLQALSVHVRYMLKTDENQITLSEELAHIASYLEMQGIRYPDRIFSIVDMPKSLEGQVIPHLLLYTVVENTFKYALGVQDTLLIMIAGQDLGESFSITVEDNGKGYPQEVLQLFSHSQLPQMSAEEKSHIGLRNVRRTLELRYGAKSRLILENVLEGGQIQGARATMILPKQASGLS